ncbi:MAG: ABC transporter permease [Acidobacteriota bacterium]
MLRYAFLLREFVRRDFESRYAGSLLGFIWSLLQPAFQLVLFSFVFSTVLKIPLWGERTDNFAIFLFCGLMPWLAVHEGIQRAATAITDNANLVKKIHFPAEVLVLAVVLAAVLHQGIASAVFLLVLAAVGELHLASLALLSVALPIQIALTLGIGLASATTHVFFRDVGQLLGVLLMGWFYFTPIVYPLAAVPEEWRYLVNLNPMSPLVDLYRQAFLGGSLFAVEGLWLTVVVAGAALALGLVLFRRLKPTFADEL